MKRVAFQTLGCKVNFYDTESLMQTFTDSGYEIVNFKEKADVYVINTCTVTNEGARKSRQMVRQAKRRHPDSFVAVVGCYSQIAPEEVLQITGVDLVIGTKGKKRLVQMIEAARDAQLPLDFVEKMGERESFEEIPVQRFIGRTRATIKIEDGCDQYCSYCIIPYARGPVRSRHPKSALNEVKNLVQMGVQEIVLTGIHLGAYGQDLAAEMNLVELIKMFLPIQGLKQIRLSSLEITEVTDELISLLVDEPQLCPHLHLPLQAGSDLILKMMNRPYTKGHFASRVEKIRDLLPDIAITTDVMVGFPGETAALFQETYDFVQKIAFSQLHVFKYSARPGTRAAEFDSQLSKEVKDQRSQELRRLGDELSFKYKKRFLGQTLPVLVETERDQMTGMLTGITPNYLRVYLRPDQNLIPGQISLVKLLEHYDDHAILGEVL